MLAKDDRFWLFSICFFEWPQNDFMIVSTWDKSSWWYLELAPCSLLSCFALILAQDSWICRWSPTDAINAFDMSYEFVCFHPVAVLIFLLRRENADFSFGSASCKNKSIFPWRPSNAIDRRIQIIFENTILPTSIIVAFPNFDCTIVTTCCDYTFIFRVCPCHLPGWTIVCL